MIKCFCCYSFEVYYNNWHVLHCHTIEILVFTLFKYQFFIIGNISILLLHKFWIIEAIWFVFVVYIGRLPLQTWSLLTRLTWWRKRNWLKAEILSGMFHRLQFWFITQFWFYFCLIVLFLRSDQYCIPVWTDHSTEHTRICKDTVENTKWKYSTTRIHFELKNALCYYYHYPLFSGKKPYNHTWFFWDKCYYSFTYMLLLNYFTLCESLPPLDHLNPQSDINS